MGNLVAADTIDSDIHTLSQSHSLTVPDLTMTPFMPSVTMARVHLVQPCSHMAPRRWRHDRRVRVVRGVVPSHMATAQTFRCQPHCNCCNCRRSVVNPTSHESSGRAWWWRGWPHAASNVQRKRSTDKSHGKRK